MYTTREKLVLMSRLNFFPVIMLHTTGKCEGTTPRIFNLYTKHQIQVTAYLHCPPIIYPGKDTPVPKE
jgi:hypothetical protein